MPSQFLGLFQLVLDEEPDPLSLFFILPFGVEIEANEGVVGFGNVGQFSYFSFDIHRAFPPTSAGRFWQGEKGIILPMGVE